MKHILFVWIPLILFMGFLAIAAVAEFPVPFEGAIILLGGSISGYAGIKSFGVYQTSKTLPTGQGVSRQTKDKLLQILVGLYIIILEALVVQYLKPDLVIPLDELFIMAGVCSGIVLGGGQAIKTGEIMDGKQ